MPDLHAREVGPPKPGRHVIWASPETGQLVELDILSLVVLHAARMLNTEDPERIARVSPLVAGKLAHEGWFTVDEYREAWIASQVEDVDEELEQLGGMDASS